MHQTATKTTTAKGLYPYTLKPVSLNLTQAEFRTAQLELYQNTTRPQTLGSLTTKERLILGILTVIAIAGLVLVSGYSTVLFWLILVGVGIYLLLRTLGMNWYIKQEYEKQVASTALPKELEGMALSVQPHGLIMTLAADTTPPKGMHIKHAQKQAVIEWGQVTAWEETADFLFIMFCVGGQNGSQIIPKRLAKDKLPLDTIKNHLSACTPRGLIVNDPLQKR